MEQAGDIIDFTTRTKPGFMDRLKVLFGATIVINSVIKVNKDVMVENTSAEDEYIFNG